MSSERCALYNEYGEHLRWYFAEPVGACIYNVYDELSFIIGWLSVVSWTFALLPQIITNCKNKAAESQSFWFWMLWLLGDFANFSGCILTKNLVTNIALAFVYTSLTIFACLQFIWYEFLIKKYQYQREKHAYIQQQQLLLHQHPKSAPSRPVSVDIIDMDERRKHYKAKSSAPSGAVVNMWGTPQFAQRYQAKTPSLTVMSPRLRTAIKLVSRSPRMFAVSPQLNDRMRREYIAFQHERREHEENRQYCSTFGLKEEEDATSEDDSKSSAQKSKSVIKIYSDKKKKSRPTESDNGNDHEKAAKLTSSVPLKANEQTTNYGSTVLATLSSMSLNLVMLYGLNQSDYSGSSRLQYEEYQVPISRRLLHSSISSLSHVNILMFIGVILGWLSSVIYISSRIPQLRLMMKEKEVSGLNPAFFCLTFAGNATQFLSMLINRQIYHDRSDFIAKLPWLMSASVCMLQDAFILFLIYLYTGQNEKSFVRQRGKSVMSPDDVQLYDERNRGDEELGKHKRSKQKKHGHQQQTKTKNEQRQHRASHAEKREYDATGMYYSGAAKTSSNILTNTV
eukprot:CAMPEP_0197029826 /NCGR_PEP_ID=MMETSP1384-20130603/9198_1 /TAXON_ID=29189 /ORGANISM="Ammonia sp." /LENGTH=565 /DNA_ID=CAMNT_0042459063 /DNA_START=116 /DNA_END=1813 /DNA_ORIENTATION=+